MKKMLLGLLLSTTASLGFAIPYVLPEADSTIMPFDMLLLNAPEHLPIKPLNEINALLHQENTLSEAVIEKVMATLTCSEARNIDHNHILAIIDYSLPSSEKRLWVFDLNQGKLLFNTYVSHGLRSGEFLTTFFSNKFNSKASSLGVYKTDKLYYGRDGISLKLDGLDAGFNDNAGNRSVVMHGGWYVEEEFIKKYGRAGRSWGCPAVPNTIAKSLIKTIQDNALFVVYYPSERWFVKSKFLNCNQFAFSSTTPLPPEETVPKVEDQPREPILLIEGKHAKGADDIATIIVMDANSYETTFHLPAPLTRMLRRQINNKEYIALSTSEFAQLASTLTNSNGSNNILDALIFAVPVVKMIRGYYATEMHVVNLGKIKQLSLNSNQTNSYSVELEGNAKVQLRPTNRFLRWLGL